MDSSEVALIAAVIVADGVKTGSTRCLRTLNKGEEEEAEHLGVEAMAAVGLLEEAEGMIETRFVVMASSRNFKTFTKTIILSQVSSKIIIKEVSETFEQTRLAAFVITIHNDK